MARLHRARLDFPHLHWVDLARLHRARLDLAHLHWADLARLHRARLERVGRDSGESDRAGQASRE